MIELALTILAALFLGYVGFVVLILILAGLNRFV